jgi:hypothetical protein
MESETIRACQCPGCLSAEPFADREYHHQMNLLLSRLNEAQRRWFLAGEAQRRGSGAEQLLYQITGVDPKTLQRGREELAASLADHPPDRVRHRGAGRRPIEKKIR